MIIVFEDVHELTDWMELHPEYNGQVEIDNIVYENPEKVIRGKKWKPEMQL